MKVKFLKPLVVKMALYQKGKVYDLPPPDAMYYITNGYAEKVEEEKKPRQKPLTVQEIKKTEKRPVKK
jgi:hypothetical protein